MGPFLRIVIAEEDPGACELLERSLAAWGHQVVAAVRTGSDLVDRSVQTSPDLILTEITLGDPDGIEAAARVVRARLVPVVLISTQHTPDLVRRAGEVPVAAYLLKPVAQAQLQVAISLAFTTFAHVEQVRQEAAELRQALEDRKIVERAKGIIMRREGLDEQAAFRRLQKLAGKKGRKMLEVSYTILEAEESLRHALEEG